MREGNGEKREGGDFRAADAILADACVWTCQPPLLLPCSREGRGGSIDNSRVTSLRRGEPKKKMNHFFVVSSSLILFSSPGPFLFHSQTSQMS